MNMSSVASEIWRLPFATLARTASRMPSFGRSICGLRSGTQNWHRRPHPVVISTTPNVVGLSGNSSESPSVGWATSTCCGRSPPSIALWKSAIVSADSLRPSITQSIPRRSYELVCVICHAPDPPSSTRNVARCGFARIPSKSSFA